MFVGLHLVYDDDGLVLKCVLRERDLYDATIQICFIMRVYEGNLL